MNKRQTVLVTGGAGFIGSHVAEAYLAAGWRVVIVDNLSSGKLENLPREAEFIQGDIRKLDFLEILKHHSVSLVNHHAAQIDVRKSVGDPAYDAEVNILGTLNLLQACRSAPKCGFIFASSGGAIYGEQTVYPAPETHAVQPLSPYGVSKLTIENYMQIYAREFGVPGIALRYANVYGPRQNSLGEAGVVAIFCDKMRQGKQPVINGDGLQTRDFVFIEDVVAANIAALPENGFVAVNIGTGIETDILTVFRFLNEHFGGKALEQHGPAAKGEQRRSVVAHQLAGALLNWSSKVAFKDGLKRTAEWFQRQAR